MVLRGLPDDGELRLGPVALPAGRRVRSGHGSGVPVAWITQAKVPEAGKVWTALSEAHQETGLVPFLASGLHHGTERPWDQNEFGDPVDISGLDGIDAAVLLGEMWDDSTNEAGEEDEEYEEDEEFAEYIEGAIAPVLPRLPGPGPGAERPADCGGTAQGSGLARCADRAGASGPAR